MLPAGTNGRSEAAAPSMTFLMSQENIVMFTVAVVGLIVAIALGIALIRAVREEREVRTPRERPLATPPTAPDGDPPAPPALGE
jgi:hypothetical protein